MKTEMTQQHGLCTLCLSFWSILVLILGQQQKHQRDTCFCVCRSMKLI
ncbi:hypothetical protein T02_5215 [Trichinella nativa]|uniref:Uncharacterized protein n=1 Tax=Trichinella nativa TaxID=6335 RepID=A0A0V1IJI8_9BILA|nr:hypothetical protein T02_5215 [Trichinella nativa]